MKRSFNILLVISIIFLSAYCGEKNKDKSKSIYTNKAAINYVIDKPFTTDTAIVSYTIVNNAVKDIVYKLELQVFDTMVIDENKDTIFITIVTMTDVHYFNKSK